MTNQPEIDLRESLKIRLGSQEGVSELLAVLDHLIDQLAGAENHRAKVDALIDLLHWVFDGEKSEQLALLDPQDVSGWQLENNTVDRVRFFIASLKSSELRSQRLQKALVEILRTCDARGLFGDTGIPSDRGFIAEGSDRMLNYVLPRPRQDYDLSSLIQRWMGKRHIAARIQRMSPDVFAALLDVLCPPDHVENWSFLSSDFADGMQLLSVRITAQGLSRKLRARQPYEHVSESPFYRHGLIVERLAMAWKHAEPLGQVVSEWKAAAADCRARLAVVREHIERQGVSVDIVYGIDIIERSFQQLEPMIDFICTPVGPERWDKLRRSLVRRAGLIHQDRSLLHLFQKNLNLLHRKIVQRAGDTGEHYIANSPEGYRHIWWASLGGGLLTTLTAAIKCAIAGMHITGLIAGLGYGLNYAASFVAMQHLGLMLATKQPAMTAATLALSMQGQGDEERLKLLTNNTLTILSSQMAATIANILAVVAGCLGFNLLWSFASGNSYLSVDKANSLIADLSPIDSLTIFYAALTGVILWLSSLIGGWLDNWSAYHQVPGGIADLSLGRRFGAARMLRLSESIRSNIAGWGTNISLGLMLGMLPEIGTFLGIPLDVRHVTLNSGMLALAATTEGVDALGNGALIYAMFGVACMFVLNLGVSFTLSLITATRAQGLPKTVVTSLIWRVLVKVLKNPLRAFVPVFRAEHVAEAKH